MNFCVPCLFGLEGLCADELKRLGMAEVSAKNGQVLFSGGEPDIARSNINLRTGERVLLIVGETRANSFDELFEGVRAMPWETYIPADGAFPVKGHSLGSKLHSIPDCQKIIKKAVVERLRSKHKTVSLNETGAKYQIQFAIMNDAATLYIDTSGAGLHKRGYRPVGNAAPLRETLAAAIVKLSRYKGRGQVCDPFCGSGTIPIEAAMAALNRAPGLNRAASNQNPDTLGPSRASLSKTTDTRKLNLASSTKSPDTPGFASQKWGWLSNNIWDDAILDAKSNEFSGDYDIWGGDTDPKSIATAKENARRAGVAEYIRFETADAAGFHRSGSGGTIMTNPPYGERVMERNEAAELYRSFGTAFRKLDAWKMYLLSSHTEFERTFGRNATKKRKLYNGMIKCDLYMYY